jgi:hypothetical protein
MRSLAALGVGPLRFANSGLAVDDSGAVVTIRLEDGTDLDSVGAWTAFFAGANSSLLTGMQWGLFMDSRLMTEVALGLFGAAVPKGGFSNRQVLPPQHGHRMAMAFMSARAA